MQPSVIARNPMNAKFRATRYSGVSQFYFDNILRTSIDIGDLNNECNTILDFGCGHQRLKALSSNNRIVGYDKIKEFSDIDDWTSATFNTFLAIEVFYSMTVAEIRHVMEILITCEGLEKLVVGTSRLGLLNKLGMIITGNMNAHEYVQTYPAQEAKIIQEYFHVLDARPVYGLCDVVLYGRK